MSFKLFDPIIGKKSGAAICLLFVGLLFSGASFSHVGSSLAAKDILVLHSDSPEHGSTREIREAILREFNDSGEAIVLHTEFLDAKHYASKKNYEDLVSNFLGNKIADNEEMQRFGFSPGVVPAGGVIVNQPSKGLSGSVSTVLLAFSLVAGVGFWVALTAYLASKRTVTNLGRERGQFRGYFELGLVGMATLSVNREYLEVNDKLCQVLGYTQEELLNKTWLELTHPDDRAKEIEGVAALMAGGLEIYARDKRYLHKNGSIVHVFLATKCLRRSDGQVDCLVVVVQDISDRQRLTTSLEDANSFLQALIGSVPLPLFYKDKQGLYLGANQAFQDFVGLPTEQIVGKSVFDFCPPDLAEVYSAADTRLLRDGGNQIYEEAVVHADGSRRDVVFHNSTFLKADGSLGGLVGVMQDVTERNRTEKELKLGEARAKALLEMATSTNLSPEGLADLAASMAIKLTNSCDGFLGFVDKDQARLKVHHRSLDSARHCHIEEAADGYDVNELGLWKDVIVNRRTLVHNEINQGAAGGFRFPEGHMPIERFVAIPIVEDDTVWTVLGVANKKDAYNDSDIRQLALLGHGLQERLKRQEAEKELRQKKEEYRQLYEQFHMILNKIAEPLCVMTSDMKIAWVNDAYTKKVNLKLEELEGECCHRIWYGEDNICSGCPVRRCFETGQIAEDKMFMPGGAILRVKAFPMKDHVGDVSYVIKMVAEITEKVRLQREAEQAQRLAALGVLTAGLAHEINNPSGILMLNTKSLQDFFSEFLPQIKAHLVQSPARDREEAAWGEFLEDLPAMLEDMQHSARKISRLVKDLKGFAGQDALPAHESLDFNKVVQAALRLAANVIKNATGSFGVSLHPALPKIRGSFGQLEQVVLNLLMNACQAVPDRGRGLRVSTDFEKKGGRIVLKVEDQGEGMSPHVLSRIREPFFTTRRESGGTGLGLSVAMRIVSEHQGEMEFLSEPGAGTMVQVYLPVTNEEGL